MQPPYGVMEFTEEAIYTLRRIEQLRTVHGLDLAWIKTIFDLLDEVERLRAELRFLRNH
jgi:DNA-binding transcriptional MerR regulator